MIRLGVGSLLVCESNDPPHKKRDRIPITTFYLVVFSIPLYPPLFLFLYFMLFFNFFYSVICFITFFYFIQFLASKAPPVLNSARRNKPSHVIESHHVVLIIRKEHYRKHVVVSTVFEKMSVTLDLRLKRANKVYLEGVMLQLMWYSYAFFTVSWGFGGFCSWGFANTLYWHGGRSYDSSF